MDAYNHDTLSVLLFFGYRYHIIYKLTLKNHHWKNISGNSELDVRNIDLPKAVRRKPKRRGRHLASLRQFPDCYIFRQMAYPLPPRIWSLQPSCIRSSPPLQISTDIKFFCAIVQADDQFCLFVGTGENVQACFILANQPELPICENRILLSQSD